MTDATAAPEQAPEKRSKLPLIAGFVLALLLGGGGFYAALSGMIPGLSTPSVAEGPLPEALPAIAFVPVPPVIVALGPDSSSRHLKFTAQLEVNTAHSQEVTLLLPRILDVLNSYLRAVPLAEIEDPGSMARLRAQMLRRVQIVTGEGRVRDLLITEFVLG